MRARVIILIVAILLVAGFASLNWDEVTRTAPLSFGLTVSDAPLGLILLALLGLTLIAYVVSAGMHRTQTLVETRHHYKTMEAQRDLAEKAEASRFTDLRQHLDAQLRELRQRDAVASTEFEKTLLATQRDLRSHLEQMNRAMMGRLTELELRMDSRLAGLADTPTYRRDVDMLHESQLERDDRLRREAQAAPGARHPL